MAGIQRKKERSEAAHMVCWIPGLRLLRALAGDDEYEHALYSFKNHHVKTTMKTKYLTPLLLLSLLLSALGIYFADKETTRAHARNAHFERIGEIHDVMGVNSITDFHKKIDAVRMAVHANSVHKIDEEFRAKWGTGDLEKDFLRYLKKQSSVPAKMECSARSAMAADILRYAGFDVRQVVVYNVTTGLNSHTFIDVLNPETNKWETQDPDFNIYWRNAKTRERVSYAEVVSDFTAFEPCFDRGCGWDLKDSNDRSLDRFSTGYKIVSLIDRKTKKRFSVHAPDIDPNAVYIHKDKPGTFCDHVRKNCRAGFIQAGE